LSENVQIVKKGTEEFKKARLRYLDLFFNESSEDDYVPKGVSSFGEHEGKHLGHTSKKVIEAKLPMPFGCPDLFIQPSIEGDKVKSVVWFCGRIGCICVSCREDFTEQYPNHCPDPYEPWLGGDCDCGSSTCDICNPGWDEYFDDEDW